MPSVARAEEALLQASIMPYRILRGALLRTPRSKDALSSYLRLIANRNDDAAF
ncbi:hypothetical protein KCP77_01200 [Salmonella enterica subsp. enterica]|nr:hypothetical protein KCP77_01200 [Salmonella enterica subsp. enterica]